MRFHLKIQLTKRNCFFYDFYWWKRYEHSQSIFKFFISKFLFFFILFESIFLPFLLLFVFTLNFIDIHWSGYRTKTRPVLIFRTRSATSFVQFYLGLLGQLNHRDPTDSNFEIITWYTSRDSLFIYKDLWVILLWVIKGLAIISSSKCSLADESLELESTFEDLSMSHLTWLIPSVQNDSSSLSSFSCVAPNGYAYALLLTPVVSIN